VAASITGLRRRPYVRATSGMAAVSKSARKAATTWPASGSDMTPLSRVEPANNLGNESETPSIAQRNVTLMAYDVAP
jgi:hypothetical protein